MSRPSVLSKSQLVKRYKEQEQLAKASLAQLQTANATGTASNNQMRCLVAQTFASAGQAMRNRTDITVYFPTTGDDGHRQAVQWIYDNIVTPAEAIRSRRGLFIEQPRPLDPSQGTCSTSQRHPREVPDNDHLLCNEDPPPPVRACFIDPADSNRAYFLWNSSCVLIEVKPDSTDDKLLRGPRLFTEEWSCLEEAGFYQADAVLPNPSNTQEVYFFSGKQYALVNIAENKIVNGPHVIIDEWPSLNSVGYNTVEAVLPSVKSRAYFFSGEHYCLVEVAPGTNDDKVVNGSKLITTEWPSLNSAGFSTVDSSLPTPGKSGQAYFFSGDDYVRIKVAPNTTDDEIVISRRNVGDNWPSLREAFFY